jgi:hypothetical protein
VAGAAFGTGLAEWAGAGLDACDGGAGPVAVCEAALVLVLAEAEALAEAADVGGIVPAGENELGGVVGADPPQAETAAEANMIMVPQPRAASRDAAGALIKNDLITGISGYAN